MKCNGEQPCQRCQDPSSCRYDREVKKRGKPPSSLNTQSSVPFTVRFAAPKEAPVSASADGPLWTPATESGDADNSIQQIRSHSMSDNNAERPSIQNFQNGEVMNGNEWPQPVEAQYPGSNLKRWGSHSSSIIGTGATIQAPPGLPNQQIPAAMMGQPEPQVFSPSAQTYSDAFSAADAHAAGLPPGQNALRFPTDWTLPATERYPVLKPLFPYIRSFITPSQACSLLELYFTSSFNVRLHPRCHHLHVYLFRKSSILSASNPRPCSPALLASILWVAAETGGDPELLAWSPTKRRNVCERLRTLCIQLLRPLVHYDLGCAPRVVDGKPETSKPCNSADPLRENNPNSDRLLPTENQGSLDDVMTYIHIGTITSASEQKALSMRWWHAAFSLARELRLNQEKKPNSDNVQSPTAMKHAVPDFDADPFFGLGNFDFDQGLMEFMETRSEQSDNVRSPVQQGVTDLEHNEERRRTWWLCYIQDRHLALCYNRAVALLDAECEDLLLPMDEAAWQSGSFLVDPSNVQRPSFPSFQCTGHSFFDFFLPLMTIAGEILNLNHLKNDPLLGKFFHESMQTRKIEAEITGRLHEYETSLKFFEPANTQGYAIEQDADQAALHTKTVVAYATHVAQVLHILLVGKWDPSTLFDDADYVLSSPAYSSTMAHALSAASAVEQILDLDPDLSFMPYFLGIQLLQGSFPLLLILDRLSTKADRKIIDACEIIVRATEACVSTLDTEYQRNYRQILRSAITQARGRYVPQKESTFRRKAVLALYRWTRSGTGLAL